MLASQTTVAHCCSFPAACVDFTSCFLRYDPTKDEEIWAALCSPNGTITNPLPAGEQGSFVGEWLGYWPAVMRCALMCL
jgi:hypothetical protein